jgi:hypothetical protein
MPVFQFEVEKDKYIQFLTPMDQVPTVLMHQFIIVGTRDDGKPMYERFISRRDPSLDGPDGYDELIDRFGQTPSERTIFLAVEVDPMWSTGPGRKTIEGFDLAERKFTNKDDEEIVVPAFGLIIESPFTFSNHLAATNDLTPIHETIFAVKRNGTGTDTSYTFVNTGQGALDVSEELDEFEKNFDFEEYLDELADEDRMKDILGELPDDWRITAYDKRKKNKDKGKEDKPKQATRRRAAAPKGEPADSNGDGEAEEAQEADKDKPSRSRRFANMRAESKANAS